MRGSDLTLFTCGGLLLSGGAILGGSTAWSLLRVSYYFWTTDLGVELGSTVLLIVGALLCLPACWLCTVVPYNLMTLVTVSMLMLSLGLGSVANLSRAVREPVALNASMQRAMTREAFEPAVRSSFAAMQLELKCCGVNSYADWYHQSHYGRFLPPACCGRVSNGKSTERCVSPRYVGGCLRAALVELRNYTGALAALSSAIIMVLGVTLVTIAYIVVSSVVERSPHKMQPVHVASLLGPPALLPPSTPAPTMSLPRQLSVPRV